MQEMQYHIDLILETGICPFSAMIHGFQCNSGELKNILYFDRMEDPSSLSSGCQDTFELQAHEEDEAWKKLADAARAKRKASFGPARQNSSASAAASNASTQSVIRQPLQGHPSVNCPVPPVAQQQQGPPGLQQAQQVSRDIYKHTQAMFKQEPGNALFSLFGFEHLGCLLTYTWIMLFYKRIFLEPPSPRIYCPGGTE